VEQRVLIVWLYNNTGRSVFVAALFHAMINLSWGVFPPALSYYDPRLTSLILVIAAAVVVMVWGATYIDSLTQVQLAIIEELWYTINASLTCVNSTKEPFP
jgi:hypothetical protein